MCACIYTCNADEAPNKWKKEMTKIKVEINETEKRKTKKLRTVCLFY